ncbi:MAG: hypothetical protein KatS3mg077_0665 [Candidatus Binatia bacterium]|nr:MAG: hypothetical protein KatS3mg077_0665 [Candidatus Binatia bacterium]
MINQPADVRFVIDVLLAGRDMPGHPLYCRFHPQRIAVLGHSLGAVTLMALLRKQCCVEGRIAAAIFVAAPVFLATVFGPDASRPHQPPALVLHGQEDTTVPIQTGRDLYAAIAPPKFFVGIAGAGHSDLLESQLVPPIPARLAVERSVTAFIRAVILGARAELAAVLAELEAEGHEVRFE